MAEDKQTTIIGKYLLGIVSAIAVIVAATGIIALVAGYMQLSAMATEIATLNKTVIEMKTELKIYTTNSVRAEAFSKMLERLRQEERLNDRQEILIKNLQEEVRKLKTP